MNNRLTVCAVLAVALLAAGCGKKQDAEVAADNTAVAANAATPAPVAAVEGSDAYKLALRCGRISAAALEVATRDNYASKPDMALSLSTAKLIDSGAQAQMLALGTAAKKTKDQVLADFGNTPAYVPAAGEDVFATLNRECTSFIKHGKK